MANKTFHRVQGREKELKIVAGTATIGTDGVISAVSGLGIRSGSTNQSSTTHTITLGDVTGTDLYSSLLHTDYSITASGSTQLWRAETETEAVASAGTVDVVTKFVSGNLADGSVTSTPTASGQAMTLGFMFVLKNTSAT